MPGRRGPRRRATCIAGSLVRSEGVGLLDAERHLWNVTGCGADRLHRSAHPGQRKADGGRPFRVRPRGPRQRAAGSLARSDVGQPAGCRAALVERHRLRSRLTAPISHPGQRKADDGRRGGVRAAGPTPWPPGAAPEGSAPGARRRPPATPAG